jgi:hypothetical protein
MRVSNFYSGIPTRVRRHECSITVVGRRLYDGHGVTITAERADGKCVQVSLSADELARVIADANGEKP